MPSEASTKTSVLSSVDKRRPKEFGQRPGDNLVDPIAGHEDQKGGLDGKGIGLEILGHRR